MLPINQGQIPFTFLLWISRDRRVAAFAARLDSRAARGAAWRPGRARVRWV